MNARFLTNIILLLAMAAPRMGQAQQEKTLSLQEALQLARQHNPTLKATALDITVADEQIRVAKSLSLPTATLGAQYLHYFALPPFFGFGPTSSSTDVPYDRFGGRDQFSATIGARYSLYNPIAAPTRRAALLQEKVSRELYRQSAIDVAATVQQTYLGILVLAERLKLQQESLVRNQKAMADARSLLAQGRGLRVDTLWTYTAVENLKPDILKIQYAIEVGKQGLITLMGLDSLVQISLTDSLMEYEPIAVPTEQALYEQALRQRPDLQVLIAQQQMNEQQTRIAKATRLPAVHAIGQYQLQTQTRQFDWANAHWPSTSFAGAQLVLPLFTGFSNQAKIHQAQLTSAISDVRVQEQQQALKTMVKQVIAQVNETYARLQTQLRVKETTVQGYDIVQYRYARGITSRLDLTDAELALTSAQLKYLEAVFDYRSATIELARTSGNEELLK